MCSSPLRVYRSPSVCEPGHQHPRFRPLRARHLRAGSLHIPPDRGHEIDGYRSTTITERAGRALRCQAKEIDYLTRSQAIVVIPLVESPAQSRRQSWLDGLSRTDRESLEWSEWS